MLDNNCKIRHLSPFKSKLKDYREQISSISFKKEASQITSKSVHFKYFKIWFSIRLDYL